MSAEDDSRHCAIRVHAAVSRLGRQLRATNPAADLGTAGLSVLGLLHRHGALTPSQLAGHEGVRLQTLTRLLAALQAQGLVARQADAADARRSLLSLTRAGARRLAAQLHGREASLQAAIAHGLSATERAQLASCCELMERLAARLAEGTVAVTP